MKEGTNADTDLAAENAKFAKRISALRVLRILHDEYDKHLPSKERRPKTNLRKRVFTFATFAFFAVNRPALN